MSAALPGEAGLGLDMFDIARHDKDMSRFAKATDVIVVLKTLESRHQEGSANQSSTQYMSECSRVRRHNRMIDQQGVKHRTMLQASNPMYICSMCICTVCKLPGEARSNKCNVSYMCVYVYLCLYLYRHKSALKSSAGSLHLNLESGSKTLMACRAILRSPCQAWPAPKTEEEHRAVSKQPQLPAQIHD